MTDRSEQRYDNSYYFQFNVDIQKFNKILTSQSRHLLFKKKFAKSKVHTE